MPISAPGLEEILKKKDEELKKKDEAIKKKDKELAEKDQEIARLKANQRAPSAEELVFEIEDKPPKRGRRH